MTGHAVRAPRVRCHSPRWLHNPPWCNPVRGMDVTVSWWQGELLSGIGGMNLCCDVFGEHSEGEVKQGLCFHGEVCGPPRG